MTGIDGVIARVGEIESRIVALDPSTRSSVEAASAPDGTGEVAPTAAASTFAGLLEAAMSGTAGAAGASGDEARAVAAGDAPAGAETAASTTTASTTVASADATELVSALQALFAASGSTTGSASSLQQYAGLIG